MKNMILTAICCVLAVVATSEMTLAGGGGGKNNNKSRIILTNTDEPGQGTDYAVYVRKEGTRVPNTIGQLDLIFVGAGQTRQTNELKQGQYEITIIEASTVANLDDDTQIDEGDLEGLETETVTLGADDLDVEISTAGGIDDGSEDPETGT